MADGPKAITIVTGGEKDVKWFCGALADQGEDPDLWKVSDLREFLTKNPADAIGHKQDADFPQTQIVVASQDGFPDVMVVLSVAVA